MSVMQLDTSLHKDTPAAGDILIVDDTPLNLRLLSQLLTKHGYRVRVATSGMQGLRSVEMALPDLILLDIMMPDLNGYEVCRRLQADERMRAIPVVFISALDSADDKIEAFSSGGVDYVTKPFQAPEVLARVQTHLARTRAEAALKQYALDLDEARKLAETRAVEAETLRKAGAAVATTLKQEETIQRILEQLALVVPCDSANVQMRQGDTSLIVGGRGSTGSNVMVGRHIPLDDSNPARAVYATRQVQIFRNLPDHFEMFHTPPHDRVRSWLGVPLVIRDDCIGMLALESVSMDRFTPHHAQLASAFADQVAIALENARAYTEIARHVEELQTLHRIGLAISSGLDMHQVLRTLAEQCRLVVGIDSFYVALYDSETSIIRFPLYYDRAELRTVPPRDIRTDPGVTGYIIQHHQTLYLPDTLDIDPALQAEITHAGEPYMRSYIGVPLVLRDQVVGVISMQNIRPAAYTAEQIRLLETLAVQAAISIENTRLYEQAQQELTSRRQVERSLREANARLQAQLVENLALQAQLREQAIRDAVTGLFNRRYLEETLERELSRAARDGVPISAVMMDIDHFKNLNDAHGHKAGDLMLRAIGDLLRNQTRQADVACRYGGEEFVIVLPGVTLEVACRRAEQLRSNVEALRIEYEGATLTATVSVGVAVSPDHGVNSDDLLRVADMALYAAKERGRNHVVSWSGPRPDPAR
jgi:diguanylate cyclase (GGDEF)-like protein